MRAFSIAAVTRTVGLGLALLALTACTLQKQDLPGLSGPSEFGISITLEANPDVLVQNGVDRSEVLVTVRDSQGLPRGDLLLRSEIFVGGTRVGFGQLTPAARRTDSSGRTSFFYTAPPAAGDGADVENTVTIGVMPEGTDAASALPRLVTIRLVPPGSILPRVRFTPAFTFSPASPVEFQEVTFDASSTTDPDGTIVSYSWDFGDGGGGATGRIVKRRFTRTGTFLVTLTASDAAGRSASVTSAVTVGEGASPTADFFFTPTEPVCDQTIHFNATPSTAPPGRTIIRYEWNFGDSDEFVTGLLTTHRYSQAGSYMVSLIVTDDVGKTDQALEEIEVDVCP